MIFYAKFSISFLNSPPCQTFVKLLNHIIFQDTGSVIPTEREEL